MTIDTDALPDPEAEREYLLRRCADHLALAEGHADENHRALHQRFAAMYRERAETKGVVESN